MRISTKCSVALHILALLSVFEDRKLTSALIAKSTGCNAVIIRGLLSGLQKAGIVTVKRGTGGARLCKAPEEISLWDVYRAVDGAPLQELIGLHPSPSQECPVGRNIYALLAEPYGRVAQAVEQAMRSYALADLLEGYVALSPP